VLWRFPTSRHNELTT